MLLPAILGLLLLMQEPPAQPAGAASISGQVVNAVTGAAVPRAQIILSGQIEKKSIERQIAADAQGRFAFTRLPAGEYYLLAEANQYVYTRYGQRKYSPQETIALSDAEEKKDIVFRLTPQGVVAGTVLDQNGDPVPNASIRCFQVYYRGGRRQLGPAGGANSNDLGEYRAYGLAPGKYYLEITAQPKQSIGASGERRLISYGITYYPDVQDIAHAIAVNIAAGQQQRIDFNLSPVKTFTISGTVALPEGLPADAGLSVWMTSVEDSLVRPNGGAALDPKTSKFQIDGVTPGSYVLTAIVNAAGRNWLGEQPVQVDDSDIDGVHVSMAPPVDVIANAHVDADAGPYWFDLERTDRPNTFRAAPQADGSFQLRGLTSGKYILKLNTAADLYLKSARIGDTDILKDGLTISPGVSPGTLDLVIAKATGEVDGSVTDSDKPAVKADVNLMETGQDGIPFVYKSVESDALGHYNMKGVPPGDYRMVAFPEATYVDQLEPAEFNEVMRDSTPVNMDDHGHKQLDLKTVELPDD